MKNEEKIWRNLCTLKHTLSYFKLGILKKKQKLANSLSLSSLKHCCSLIDIWLFKLPKKEIRKPVGNCYEPYDTIWQEKKRVGESLTTTKSILQRIHFDLDLGSPMNNSVSTSEIELPSGWGEASTSWISDCWGSSWTKYCITNCISDVFVFVFYYFITFKFIAIRA